MSFEALFYPRSVAVIGASANPQKIGGLPVRMLREMGYAGEIFPVNPTASEIQGLRAWPSTRELPEAPDVAIVAVPAASVVASIRDCASRGVRAAVVFSSGFAEGGAAGLALQHEIARIASDSDLTLLGPNCLGVMNVRRRWIGTFSPAPLSGMPAEGSVAIVSQSGAFGAYAFVLARKAGLGVSQWITTGNEAGVSVADVIDWLADDDETRVIVAYIEGARDGDRLRRALLKARAADKPVVVTKVGRTEVGARAAMSHTASLSGEDAVYQAVFDETGAVRAFTVEQMFRLAHAFSLVPPPRGRRLAIITVSGGVGTLMADAASDAGLELPPLPPELARQLRERVPFASTENPVDVTGQITADYETLNITALGAAQNGAFDALCLFLAAASAAPVIGPRVVDTMHRLRAAAPALPLALTGIMNAQQTAELHAAGCLVYEEPTHAIDAFAVLQRWAAGGADVAPDATALPRLDVEPGTRNEAEGFAFLREAGIAAAPHRVVQSVDEAVDAWRNLGADAVVLKIVSRDILHKSDVGGVAVGPADEAQVRAAYARITAAVAQRAPDACIDGMLVAQKLKPALELLLGARHDPVFGPIVVLGLGGVAVELFAQTALLIAPTTAARVTAKLQDLKIMPLLSGWRGQPRIDPAPLVQAVVAFSELAARIGPALRSMEINPLMVLADGVAAADAVIEIDGL